MAKGEGPTVLDCFASLEDPRIERSKRHKLLDIIAIAIAIYATICGTDSWVHIEMFGRSKEEWFRTFLELPGTAGGHPVPRHLRRGVLPSGPRAVPKLLYGLDPGGGPTGPTGSGGH